MNHQLIQQLREAGFNVKEVAGQWDWFYSRDTNLPAFSFSSLPDEQTAWREAHEVALFLGLLGGPSPRARILEHIEQIHALLEGAPAALRVLILPVFSSLQGDLQILRSGEAE